MRDVFLDVLRVITRTTDVPRVIIWPIDDPRPEGEVPGVAQNTQAISVDQLLEGSGISLATAEQRPLRLSGIRSRTPTHEPLVDERSGCTEQAFARQGTGLQRGEVEVT